jgi:helicase
MVSYHYAQAIKQKPKGILFVDSGGFASLFDGSEALDKGEYVVIHTKEGNEISPPDVLTFQERHADIGATVDFIIPPNCDPKEAEKRQEWTIKNALWAVRNRTKKDFRLYASIQAWDECATRRIVEQLAPEPFDGFALGGMVPRIKRPDEILAIVRAIRTIDPERPLHVFGIGNAELIRALFREGVTSVDSSSWVRAAADGRYIDPKTGNVQDVIISELSECNCPSCTKLGADYLALEGEANRMALALHNLHALSVSSGLASATLSVV